ncbi:hypothetical protein [Kineosporia babensis]|uniref:GIY-YIG nuclease family protein n=1 Tax=Kineosporia babensis TaxID=499548 RepID=A0A9X1T0P2_9ACTN|nr:hypothetical protein [Kineosporia babensis]MCD5312988.1 hypothetical protein [Kineosporia babensis]
MDSELSPDTIPAQAGAYNRAEEVDRLLAIDGSLLGRIHEYDRAGLTPQEMAEREGNATPGFVFNYRAQIAALRDGKVPNSPTLSIQAARKLRAWLKNPRIDLSNELRRELQALEAELTEAGENSKAQTREVEEAVDRSRAAESSGTPGIYVYTLPHYLRYPFDPESGRTLLKVGHSGKDAYYRATSQGRLTALPEEPILLRIYPTEGDSAAVEKDFHSWLADADHAGQRTQRAGSEWFITSTKFLDRVAKTQGLEVKVVTDFEAGDL